MAIRRSGRTSIPSKRYPKEAAENLSIASSSDVDDEAHVDANDEEFVVDLAADEAEEESEGAPTENSGGSPRQPASNEDVDMLDEEHSKRRMSKAQEAQVHSSGNRAPDKFAAKQESIRALFGLDPGDLLPFILSRNKWLHDPIYPTRQEERQAGGLGFFPGFTEAMRAQEAHSGWDWLDRDQGQQKFKRGQQRRVLAVEGPSYLPASCDAHRLLLGPYGKQTLYELAAFEAIDASPAWRSAERESERSRGWILNAGAKILCLDWAPNQDGDTQYLAVGVASKLQRSALDPSELFKSPIQIWSVVRGLERPRLVEVICTHWGSISEFKWCPMQRQRPASDGTVVPLGLSASIWSDGHVRVLDINHEKAETTTFTSYHSIFAACPPATVATTLTWLSPTILAVGLANGFLAIYNLLHALHHSGPPVPYLYTAIHQSYIYSLISAYPLHPHLLISTSVDGYLRLTDVRTPDTDFVLGQRARLGPVALAYSPALQSAIAPGDSDRTIRLLPLRRFYSSSSIAKVAAQVLSMATGSTHTSLLVGSVDGTVMATNPMRRVVAPKKPPLQLAWFKYEWIRGKEQGQGHTGMSRFTEGYKVEVPRAKDVPRGKAAQGGFETIHEEKTGITALTWNPNVHVGAWAAAGTGSGLVRVEDLAM